MPYSLWFLTPLLLMALLIYLKVGHCLSFILELKLNCQIWPEKRGREREAMRGGKTGCPGVSFVRCRRIFFLSKYILLGVLEWKVKEIWRRKRDILIMRLLRTIIYIMNTDYYIKSYFNVDLITPPSPALRWRWNLNREIECKDECLQVYKRINNQKNNYRKKRVYGNYNEFFSLM